MGFFKRKTKWELVTEPGDVRPGGVVRAALVATRIKEGDRIAVAWAKLTADGRKVTSTYQHSSNPDTPPSPDEHTTIQFVDVEILRDVQLVGEEMRVPFEVKLPIWMPPTIVGETRVLPSSGGPFLSVSPEYDKKAELEIQGLPVHETLLAGIEALGCTVKKGKLWDHYRKKGKRNFDHRIECSAPEGLDHDDAKVTGVVVTVAAVAPAKAKTDVVVMARKFPKGLFPLVTVDDVALGDDAAAWAADVKQRLKDELEKARVEKEAFVDANVIAGVLDAWLS